MAPGSHINIYYKSLNDDGEVMFGKFISNIEVLDVKDSSGVDMYLKIVMKQEHLLICYLQYQKKHTYY